MSKSTRWDSKKNESKHLPIYKHKAKLIQAVKGSTFLVVTGETGSGKTTQLPQYLYQAGICKDGSIGITQPRRVAAITVAQRVAHEMQCTLGREVGYQVRFDDCTSQDILLGLLKKMFSSPAKATKGRAIPLKVVVMSATLETDKLSSFLGDCPVFAIPGRTFPVTCTFGSAVGPKDIESTGYVKEVVKMALDVHTSEMAGDILVFLTDQQRQIFQPPPSGIRKCVVATNIAATSLTINGIKYIIDSGFVKQLNHNSRVGMDILEVVPISKSEAQQRAGRAGRTSAGKCFRIYTKEFWEKSMPEYTVPEIQRTSLTAVILTLKCLGVHDVIRSVGKVFCTMDGHGSMVHIHPSSSLFDQEGELNWVIFHDVLVTSRVYIRTVCPIRYEWVKDLLPKLHEVDVYELSSVAREEVTDEEMIKWETREAAKRQSEVSTEDVMKKLEKRNNETTVSDARARYLQRKQQKQQSKAL